jgi:hypothetical protein
MLTLAYWNVHGLDNTQRLSDFARQLMLQPDERVLIGFSEAELINDAALASDLGSAWSVQRSLSKRFGLVTNLPTGSFRFLPEQNGCLPLALDSVNNGKPTTTLAWLVHLPAPVREPHPDAYRLMQASALQRNVVALESSEKTPRSVLIGDFNMEPYSPGMTALDGLNAVMCRFLAQRPPRKRGGVKRRYFYNPMWGLLGDQTSLSQPASYYMPSDTGALWHAIDQVLIRPEIIAEIHGIPSIVTGIAGQDLLSPRSRQVEKTISDHLPISIRLAT